MIFLSKLLLVVSCQQTSFFVKYCSLEKKMYIICLEFLYTIPYILCQEYHVLKMFYTKYTEL